MTETSRKVFSLPLLEEECVFLDLRLLTNKARAVSVSHFYLIQFLKHRSFFPGSCQATTGHSAHTSCSSDVFLQAFSVLLGAASFSPSLLPTMEASQHNKARICRGKKIKNEGRFFVLFCFLIISNKPVKKHCQGYCIITFWASRRLDQVQGRESKN